MSNPDGRQFTADQAAEHARKWCERHPKWARYCDIPDDVTARLTLGWDELTSSERAGYRELYSTESGAQMHYAEFASNRPQRHRYGFVSGAGVFYAECTDVPWGHNLMMVFQTGGKPGRYYQGGTGTVSGTGAPRANTIAGRPVRGWKRKQRRGARAPWQADGSGI